MNDANFYNFLTLFDYDINLNRLQVLTNLCLPFGSAILPTFTRCKIRRFHNEKIFSSGAKFQDYLQFFWSEEFVQTQN